MDSGLGGLSVVRLIQQQLPNESIVFVGDEGHFPYGTKNGSTISGVDIEISLSIPISDFCFYTPEMSI